MQLTAHCLWLIFVQYNDGTAIHKVTEPGEGTSTLVCVVTSVPPFPLAFCTLDFTTFEESVRVSIPFWL